MLTRSVGILLLSLSAGATEPVHRTIRADVWADNWFALYIGEELVKEDSVAYNTERSFNAESFSFEAELPVQINVIIKDFKENDTGLEYIGRPRQQMGDGGFIAQFFDARTNELLGATGDAWRCIAVHRAPLNKSCERSTNPETECETEIQDVPADWMAVEFDASDWPRATIHTASAVRPRGDFDRIDWNPVARLIWGEDLETDNTILCRFNLAAGK